MGGILYLFFSSKNEVGRFCVWSIREILINTLLFSLVVEIGGGITNFTCYFWRESVFVLAGFFLQKMVAFGDIISGSFQVVTQQNKQNVDRRGVFVLSGFREYYTIIIIYEALSKTRACASGLHSLACAQNLNLPFFSVSLLQTFDLMFWKKELTSIVAHKMW